jgi:hypothetical protein
MPNKEKTGSTVFTIFPIWFAIDRTEIENLILARSGFDLHVELSGYVKSSNSIP